MVLVAVATIAEHNLSILEPASPSAQAIRGLFYLVLAITGGIFLLVQGILIVALVRNRRRNGRGEIEPPQVYGSKPIEIAWTAGPALVVFVLILLVGRVIWEVRVDPNRPPAGAQAVHITVVGHQWWWEYQYESYDGRKLGFTTANELHIPVSTPDTPRPVYLNLQSADVCHSFWVPRLGGKTDLLPARSNTMWLQTDQPGTYSGQCAEYCGTQHAHMLIQVVAESPEAFDRWLTAESQPAVENPSHRAGREKFLALACAECHTIRSGNAGAARGTFGPDLTHLMSRKTLASGMIANTPENLRSWVLNPHATKPGCLMPGFALRGQEMDLVMGYLLSLE